MRRTVNTKIDRFVISVEYEGDRALAVTADDGSRDPGSFISTEDLNYTKLEVAEALVALARKLGWKP